MGTLKRLTESKPGRRPGFSGPMGHFPEKGGKRRAWGWLLLLLGAVFLTYGFSSASDYETGFRGATRDYDKSLETNDPVSAANGAYHFSSPLLALGGPMNPAFTLIYRSDLLRFFGNYLPESFWWSPLGRGSSGFEYDGVPHATVYLPNGDQISFMQETPGQWTLTRSEVDIDGFVYTDNLPRTKYVLKETDDFLYLMDPVAEQVYQLKKLSSYGTTDNWLLDRITDRNGNSLVYTYSTVSGSKDRLLRVEDGLGRSLDFSYFSQTGFRTMLQKVTDQSGREVTLTHEPNGADNDNRETLRSVTGPMGNTTTFQYGGKVFLNNLITGKTLPIGNTPYTQTYALHSLYGEEFPRVTSQQDAYGNTSELTYDATADTLTVDAADGTSRQFEHYSSHGLPKGVTDESGRTMQFAKSPEEHVTAVTDRIGDTTQLGFDGASGLPTSITNAEGGVLGYTYTSRNQTFTNPVNNEQVPFTFRELTRIDYPDGTNEQFTYDDRGNMLTHTDRAGGTRTYTCNGRGQILTVTNPAGGVVANTYNDDATLATSTDSDTGTTTYGYDGFKRLNRITHPDGSFMTMTQDLNDRLTAITDENGHTYGYEYDANANLLLVTDPDGHTTRYAHDLMDRVTRITDRLGNATEISYDSTGRVASVTGADQLTTSYGFDPRGWQNAATTGGQSRRTGYDDEGVAVSTTTPLGHATSYSTDRLGHVTGITDPLGQTTTYTRDAMGRVVAITDPLNRTVTYGYDDRGLLTSVTSPLIGTAVYRRNGLGLLDRITDLNGKNWLFAYSAMGRPISSTDPLGNMTAYGYDSRGRRISTSHADGSTTAIAFDEAGNKLAKTHSDGTDLQFAYDPLDRIVSADGLDLTRDPEGRIIATANGGAVFGATYDAGGRQSSLTYNNDLFTVTYTYDPATGLLSGVTDGLTGAGVDLTYDDDRRPTGISRSNGVHRTNTYDDAGRLTRIQEGSIIDLRYTLDAAGRVISAWTSVPLDPETLLTDTTDAFAYDDASQVTGAEYGYDPRGRLTASPGHTYAWDGESRLRAIDGTVLAYNGVNDLVSRTAGDETIRYFYNHAVGIKPVMAEQDGATGAFLRYYVWTPEGSLLYMIDGADGNKVYFYHFDRTGSTLALTDQEKTVTDAYAYTPYGELLGHNGTSSQPFTFAGRWGVRQEGSGALYHMRARYYDAKTARFLSRDPVWPLETDPKGLNPYQYAGCEPIASVDPGGLLWGKNVLKWGLKKLAGEQVSDSVLPDFEDIADDEFSLGGLVYSMVVVPEEVLIYAAGDYAAEKAEAERNEEFEKYWQDKEAERAREKALREITKKEEEQVAEKWKDPAYAKAQLRQFIRNFQGDPDKKDLLEIARQKLRELEGTAESEEMIYTPARHIGRREAPYKPGSALDPQLLEMTQPPHGRNYRFVY